MNKKRRKIIVVVLLSCLISLAACEHIDKEHNHAVESVTTTDYVGYAWERDHYYMLYGHMEGKTGPMYESLGTEFCERVSFMIEQKAEDGNKYVLASFDITDIDTYVEIMQHLYEQFNIQVENITYSDGCTERKLKLLGLVKEQKEKE